MRHVDILYKFPFTFSEEATLQVPCMCLQTGVVCYAYDEDVIIF